MHETTQNNSWKEDVPDKHVGNNFWRIITYQLSLALIYVHY